MTDPSGTTAAGRTYTTQDRVCKQLEVTSAYIRDLLSQSKCPQDFPLECVFQANRRLTSCQEAWLSLQEDESAADTKLNKILPISRLDVTKEKSRISSHPIISEEHYDSIYAQHGKTQLPRHLKDVKNLSRAKLEVAWKTSTGIDTILAQYSTIESNLQAFVQCYRSGFKFLEPYNVGNDLLQTLKAIEYMVGAMEDLKQQQFAQGNSTRRSRTQDMLDHKDELREQAFEEFKSIFTQSSEELLTLKDLWAAEDIVRHYLTIDNLTPPGTPRTAEEQVECNGEAYDLVHSLYKTMSPYSDLEVTTADVISHCQDAANAIWSMYAYNESLLARLKLARANRNDYTLRRAVPVSDLETACCNLVDHFGAITTGKTETEARKSFIDHCLDLEATCAEILTYIHLPDDVDLFPGDEVMQRSLDKVGRWLSFGNGTVTPSTSAAGTQTGVSYRDALLQKNPI